MNVLLNDGFDKSGLKIFEDAGIKYCLDSLKPEALEGVISKYNALIVRSETKVTPSVLNAGARGNLVFVGRSGVGYNNISVKDASNNGIVVSIAPNGNSNSTAELSIGLMFSLARNIPQANKSLHSGEWNKKMFSGSELEDKVLGIIGVGRIGKKEAQKANALGMKIIGYDIIKINVPYIEQQSLHGLLTKSDFVSVHASSEEKIIGKNELDLMKPSAYLINTARSSNIDYPELYSHLVSERIKGAAIDVHPNEPKGIDSYYSIFQGMENVIITPHLGASTNEAQEKTSREMAKITVDYLLNGNIKEGINISDMHRTEKSPTPYRLITCERKGPKIFGPVADILGDNNIDIRLIGEQNFFINKSQEGTEKLDYSNSFYFIDKPISPDVLENIRKISGIYRAVCIG